jgi:hypothetical protein
LCWTATTSVGGKVSPVDHLTVGDSPRQDIRLPKISKRHERFTKIADLAVFNWACAFCNEIAPIAA